MQHEKPPGAGFAVEAAATVLTDTVLASTAAGRLLAKQRAVMIATTGGTRVPGCAFIPVSTSRLTTIEFSSLVTYCQSPSPRYPPRKALRQRIAEDFLPNGCRARAA